MLHCIGGFLVYAGILFCRNYTGNGEQVLCLWRRLVLLYGLLYFGQHFVAAAYTL